MMLELGHFIQQIKNTWKVLIYGAGKEWRSLLQQENSSPLCFLRVRIIINPVKTQQFCSAICNYAFQPKRP
jgi:hypothetical protein